MIGVDASRTLSRETFSLPYCHRKARLSVVICSIALALMTVVARLTHIQLTGRTPWLESALKQHLCKKRIASQRGDIVDRNERRLASSLEAGSVYVYPEKIRARPDRHAIVSELSSILGVRQGEIDRIIKEENGYTILPPRQVPLVVAQRLLTLKRPQSELGFEVVSRRFYPFGESASSLLGKVGNEGKPLSGLELKYDKELRREDQTHLFGVDGRGNNIHPGLFYSAAEGSLGRPQGDTVRLTLDVELQQILDEELQRGKAKTQAKATMGVMIDALTGEVLAMSQAPSHNLNSLSVPSRSAFRNLVSQNAFEPGSTMKPFIAAAAMEEGVVNADELIDCGKGGFKYADRIINDTHRVGLARFHEVVVQSSNIGMTKVGDRLGAERLYSYLSRLGFGRKTSLLLPGESPGMLRPLSKWSKVDIATHAFGQGISTTALQLTRAMAAIANGGVLHPLILRSDRGIQEEGARVFSRATVASVQGMLRDVVEDDKGTAQAAQIPGVKVYGKTGTAQKADLKRGGYHKDKYFSSFLGYVEARQHGIPQLLTLFVGVDEPQGKKDEYYGGVAAAPVFRRVAERSLQVLSTRRDLSLVPDMQQPSRSLLSPVTYRPR
jgi:cell division protein FtsI (penicillin-binding protein 3)